MIYGIVGTYDDNTMDTLRGNGKTMGMSYFLHDARTRLGWNVITNYHTNFSEQMNTEEMTDLILHGNMRKIAAGIDEIQVILNSIGTQGKIVTFIDKMISQTRKRQTDVFYTTQRFLNVHKRLRVQTDMVIVARKYHWDEGDQIALPCRKDRCEETNHVIALFSVVPYRPGPLMVIRAGVVGKLYDSDEVVDETFHAPPKEEEKERKPKKVKAKKLQEVTDVTKKPTKGPDSGGGIPAFEQMKREIMEKRGISP